MAHPAAALSTIVDAESLDAAHAVEVYNALAAREDRGDSWHLTDVLLNRGHRLSAYAADDAHLQPRTRRVAPPGSSPDMEVHRGQEWRNPNRPRTELRPHGSVVAVSAPPS